jgi:hypothetical protein
MTAAVTKVRIATASDYLRNADIAAVACREANLPFYVACALLEKESGGRNIYGHDAGGALSGFPGEVNKDNYAVFKWLVFERGMSSNGVGPAQITYKGYFTDMEKRGLKPYDAHDSMLYGFELLKANYDRAGTWTAAGAVYNGGPRPNYTALAYGRDFAVKVAAWKKRLGIS